MDYDLTTAVESDNINSIWLKNVFESLKNLEIMQRNAREGCSSLFEYLQIPMEHRNAILADAQYKNLKFMVTEFSLLLSKLAPILEPDDVEKLDGINQRFLKIIDHKNIFIKELRRNNFPYSQTTPAFDETLNLISLQVSKIIMKIEHLLYIKNEDNKPKW
jgi:hypothetical protein